MHVYVWVGGGGEVRERGLPTLRAPLSGTFLQGRMLYTSVWSLGFTISIRMISHQPVLSTDWLYGVERTCDVVAVLCGISHVPINSSVRTPLHWIIIINNNIPRYLKRHAVSC